MPEEYDPQLQDSAVNNTDFTPSEFSEDQLSANEIQNPNVVRFDSASLIPVSGSTPYGLFDNDTAFQIQAPQSALYAAYQLGYPIVDVEMNAVNFYTCFEQAVADYGATVNAFNIRENISALQGMPTSTNVTQQNIQSIGLPSAITLAQVYSTEMGVGGNVDWKHVSFLTSPGLGVYDLQAVLGDVLENGNRIEIRRVFHKEPPASKIFAPFATTGLLGGGEGQPVDLLQELGGGASGGWQFFMTPVFEDLLRWQAVEFNQQLRRSLFSFELVNNKIRIFPIPTHTFRIWVDYLVVKDRNAQVMFDSNGNMIQNASDTSSLSGSNPTGGDPFFPDVGAWGSQIVTSGSQSFAIPAATSTALDNLYTLDGFGEGAFGFYEGYDPYWPVDDPNWPGDQAPGYTGSFPPWTPPLQPTASAAPAAEPVIGDYSNVPYNFITYSNINSVGLQWIRKYFLALCKETLGIIRSKYSTINIPNSETTLDGSELRAEAAQEKEALLKQLQENLEVSGKAHQMEIRAAQAKQLEEQLKSVPLMICVG